MRTAADIRRAELATIHIGKQQLGLDDDAYRDLLFAITAKRSSSDLDRLGRKKVIEHFRALGVPRDQRRKDPPHLRMARGLWIELHRAGAVVDASDRALAAYARRVTGCDALDWATTAGLNAVIEGLKAWSARVRAGAARGHVKDSNERPT